VLQYAKEQNFPFLPGVMTPTDIDSSIHAGYLVQKFFPADTAGGLLHLQKIAAPFRHLGVSFLALSGIKEDNLTNWLESPLIGSVGGSWLADKTLIQNKDWKEIQSRAANAIERIADIARC
jgi:2-dehydro-3-deoxyphosphogluconate aldolase/(4S)-4-hydroxy-2-oxoglutarate aldolase